MHRVWPSRRGALAARVRVSGSGWVRLVTRQGGQRVVNRFRVTGHRRSGDVVELASSLRPRVRFSPSPLTPGGVLRVRGTGYGRGVRLRLSGVGRVRALGVGRRGTFDLATTVPANLRSTATLRLVGGGVRFRVRLRVRPPAAKAPVNVSAPAVAGAAWAGQVLTATTGVWSDGQTIEYSYSWQRCDVTGADCSRIAGATAPRYTVADGDRGHRLRIAVTASNANGAATAVSTPTELVTATPGVLQAPTVPTAAQEAQTIEASPAIFSDPAPATVSFRWQRCAATCVDVGAGQTSYEVGAADVGARLQVVETATWPAKTLELTSNKTDPVQPATSASGVIARWHMDDGGPTMVDSARGHDGALHDVATGLPGFTNAAFGFNGTDSYVTVAAADDLSPISHDVTLTIRMKTTHLPPSTVQDWDLIRSSGGYYDGDEYKMEYAPDGSAHCAFKGNGSTGYKEVVSGGAPLNDGVWHTIQCVKTATQVKTIIDDRVYAKSATIGAITITKGVIIGAHANSTGKASSEFYNGMLDEASLVFS
jgi:hypothetical protein